MPDWAPLAPFFWLGDKKDKTAYFKMIKTILGSKKEMNQAFVEGRRVCVTKILAGPCVVTQVKNPDKDGYWAIQIGFGSKKLKNIKKPLQGHLKKIIEGKNAPDFLHEIRFSKEPERVKGEVFKVGDKILLSDIFKKGDIVNVSGRSKGKGFAGVVKRWKFSGGPKTHGQSDRQRAPGSISGGTTPGRVRKGKKMAGRMGNEKVTVKNLQIIDTDAEQGIIFLSGQVPGIYGGNLIINKVKEGKLEGLSEIQKQAVVVEGAGEEAGETSEVKEEPEKQETEEKGTN